MNILKRLWDRTPKVIEVPTDERQQLEGVETWCVQWNSRSGNHPTAPHLTSLHSVSQAFTNEADAIAFKKALLDAYALVRDTISPLAVEHFKM